MSDILIKGVQMPKNGETITITICGDGIVFEEWKEPGSVFKAVPVPPHGDLIDRDPFVQFIKSHWDSSDQWFVEQLEARPTIIPAEEGK